MGTGGRFRWVALGALACLLVTGAPTVARQVPRLPGRWTTAGLEGGVVGAISTDPFDPDHVVVGTRQGLFSSLDGAGHWTPSSTGLTQVSVNTVEFDPVTRGVVYAGTNEGLFRSIDGGTLWVRVPTFGVVLGERWVNDVDVLNGDGKRILVSTGWKVAASDDDGLTWRTLYEQKNIQIMSMVNAPSDPAVVYLTTADVESGVRALHRSDDGGETWTAVQESRRVWALSVDLRDPLTIVAMSEQGLLKTADGGATWAPVVAPARGTPLTIARAPSDPETLYVSGRYEPEAGRFVWKSVDGGDTWVHVADHRESAYSGGFAVRPDNRDVLYWATFGNGIAVSSDGGRTFSYSNTGLTAAPARDIALDPTNPARMFAVTWGRGVFRSNDAGATWSRSTAVFDDPLHPLAAVMLRRVAVDAGSRVYVTRILEHGEGEAAVFRSDDGGDTWVPAAPIPPDGFGSAFEAHPTEPGWLLAGTARGVYRTTDGAATWQPVGPFDGAVADLVVHPDGKTVYVATGNALMETQDHSRLYVSRDFGDTWDRLTYPPLQWVVSLGLRETPEVLYAGSWGDGQIAISVDGGKTWVPSLVDPSRRAGPIMAVAPDPLDPTQVLAGTREGGLWLSRDAGATWFPTTPGIYGHEVYDVVFTPLAVDLPGGLPDVLDAVPALTGVDLDEAAGVSTLVLAPNSYRAPRTSGNASPGGTLTCAKGRWSRAEDFAYTWLRDGRPSGEAAGRTYEVSRSDRGSKISCRVTGRGPGGRGSARSRPVPVS